MTEVVVCDSTDRVDWSWEIQILPISRPDASDVKVPPSQQWQLVLVSQ